MIQIIVCNDQGKCGNYLLSPACDICSKNMNERIDNFIEEKPAGITFSRVDTESKIHNEGLFYDLLKPQ